MSCEFGHVWKVTRKDKLCTEEGTLVIVFFRCRVCGCAFSSDEAELEEKDFEGAENYERKE